MMVEQVAEVGDDTVSLGIVVVRAEHRRHTVVVEYLAYAAECGTRDHNVGIDEDENRVPRVRASEVPSLRGPGVRGLRDDDDLLRWVGRRSDGRETAIERYRRVSRWHDDAEREFRRLCRRVEQARIVADPSCAAKPLEDPVAAEGTIFGALMRAAAIEGSRDV
jgi:hypothetical protein